MPRKPSGVQVQVEKLIELRKAKGWSQEDLAGVTELNVKTVQRAEGEHYISIDNVRLIADALGVAYEELVKPGVRKIRGTLTIEVDEELLKDPVTRAAFFEVLEKMAKLKHGLDFDEMSPGSVKLHVWMAPDDADRLIAGIKEAKESARLQIRRSFQLRGSSTLRHRIPDQQLDAYRAILSITEIHIPESDLHEEVTWRDGDS